LAPLLRVLRLEMQKGGELWWTTYSLTRALFGFEDLPDPEELLGRKHLSSLEDLPDLEDLLDPPGIGAPWAFESFQP
jgi:hypothetical protein